VARRGISPGVPDGSGQGFGELAYLSIIQLAQQLYGRGRDLHGHGLNGLSYVLVVAADGALIEFTLAYLLAHALKGVEVVWQLRATVPGDVFAQLFAQTGLLVAVHVQIVVQRPGNQQVQVAIGEVDTTAADQRHRHCQQQQQCPGARCQANPHRDPSFW